jgi:hypothetical protein
MQTNTERRAQGLREKIPDIQKTLDMVQFLSTRKVGHVIPLRPLLNADGFHLLAGFRSTRNDIRAQ